MSRILIVEDEPRIVSFLEKGLRANGFITTVATTAQEAIDLACSGDFELLLLDLNLPGDDGLAVLASLRGQGVTMPVIILSARNDLDNKVAGLEGGANDYVTKPFRFEELLARIRVQLRQQYSSSSDPQWTLNSGEVSLDLRTRKVHIGSKVIELSAREFALTEVFLRHPGQVLTREQLLSHVWGYDYDPGSNVVDVHVRNLRQKLGSDLIETVRGMGYRLPSQS
jgi:DNA-binding response OmpR family regulator